MVARILIEHLTGDTARSEAGISARRRQDSHRVDHHSARLAVVTVDPSVAVLERMETALPCSDRDSQDWPASPF